jgi:GNAT superfamily N-acetyltransferase
MTPIDLITWIDRSSRPTRYLRTCGAIEGPAYADYRHYATAVKSRSPVGQANDGWLRLPAGGAHLKDFVTAESHRGLGIAPGAISAIAGMLAADKVEWVHRQTGSRQCSEPPCLREAWLLEDPG